MRYRSNDGGPADFVRAASFFKRGCDIGFADSCVALATAYVRGRGVPADPKLALSMFLSACNRYQSAYGCNNAASVIEDGVGTTKDPEMAALYYGIACQRG